MAAKDAAARKEQRRRDEKHQVDVLKALREGGKQMKVIAEEQTKIQEGRSESQALLRTMLLQSILQSKGELATSHNLGPFCKKIETATPPYHEADLDNAQNSAPGRGSRSAT
jgi:hypothetical protein